MKRGAYVEHLKPANDMRGVLDGAEKGCSFQPAGLTAVLMG